MLICCMFFATDQHFQIGGRGTRAPSGSKFFNFMQYLEKFCKIICWRPPRGLAPPPRGNPGSATDQCVCRFDFPVRILTKLLIGLQKMLKLTFGEHHIHTSCRNHDEGMYRSGTVNSNTVNSKFHLIRSYCEIFCYHFPNISCLKCTVNSNFHFIRSKILPTNDFELTVPNLYQNW